MVVSEARRAANRRNSLKSTGPKTPEGKEKSRANALKHGLCASVCVPEDLETVQRRSTDFFDTLKPQNLIHVWMVNQAALYSVRIERSQRMERRIRDKISLRAELTWDDDRRFEAEDIGRKLGKDPASAVEALRRTSHGCEWMMTRWAMLAHAADTQKEGWTDAQIKLAFDLLATPHEFREGRKPGLMIDLEGRVIDDGEDSAAVARREIEALKDHREIVADLDEVNQALAAADLTNEGDPELRRLRRYESALFNEDALVPETDHDSIALSGPRPEPPASVGDGTRADTGARTEASGRGRRRGVDARVHPAAVLPRTREKFPEPGQNADIPKILAGRREKRFRKAESRREANRRKAQKLRA